MEQRDGPHFSYIKVRRWEFLQPVSAGRMNPIDNHLCDPWQSSTPPVLPYIYNLFVTFNSGGHSLLQQNGAIPASECAPGMQDYVEMD